MWLQFLDTKVLVMAARAIATSKRSPPLLRDAGSSGRRRRGVVFLPRDRSARLVALAARLLYNSRTTRFNPSSIKAPVGATPAASLWGKSSAGWNEIEAACRRAPRAVAGLAGCLHHEQLGYNVQRNGGTMEPGRALGVGLWAGSAGHLRADFNDLDDPDLAACLQDAPTSLFVADGSPVAVFRGQRIG